MVDDVLITEESDLQVYEAVIPVRGYELSLSIVRAAYREFVTLTKGEGRRIVGTLKKPEDISEEDFAQRNSFVEKDAFRVTVSIIGFDGQTTLDDHERIFNSKNLPMPIKTIYFTNITAFRPHANGQEPITSFQLWLHFDKPPLFDPSPLLSEPTRNGSEVIVKAHDLAYFRAAQQIVQDKLFKQRTMFSFIHEKFAYDVGLWFIAMPSALYVITSKLDQFVPSDGKFGSYRVALFIYGIGTSIIIYRTLAGYLKWAFPLNILIENKDKAWRHRVIFGAIFFSLITAIVRSMLSTFFNIG